MKSDCSCEYCGRNDQVDAYIVEEPGPTGFPYIWRARTLCPSCAIEYDAEKDADHQ